MRALALAHTPGLALDPEVDGLLAAGAPVAIGVSGGKDSTALALATAAHLDAVGHAGPRLLVHADLGRVEWSTSRTKCEELAGRLGLELVVVRRKAGDLMDRWLSRWAESVRRYVELECVKVILPWSTPSMRFCTSELKVDVITRELVRRWPGRGIVSASGIRREESTARAKAPVASRQAKLARKGAGTWGLDWHPILDWTLEDVLAAHERAGVELHEAYTTWGSTRVSCRFCIMGSAADLVASARDPEARALYREMVGLELDSTFAFQGGKWLADVAPHLLDEDARTRVPDAKRRAAERARVEAEVPDHLLYVKGWPTCVPTEAEAELLASVRRRVGAMLGLPVRYATGPDVRARYAELVAEREAREARAA